MPEGPVDGSPPDRLAKARCLVPLLGHVTIRLASLSPVLQLVREAAQRTANASQWGDESDPRGEACHAEPEEISSGPVFEARVASDEVLARTAAVSRFTTELSELCAAEGEWLAILALAPRVLRKFRDDFSQLAGALDSFAELLSTAVDSTGKSSPVAAQPSATALAVSDSAASPVPSHMLEGIFAEPGRVAAISAMVATISADLKTDLDSESPLGSARLKPELEISADLHRRLSTKTSDVANDAHGSEVSFLERLSKLNGTGAANRPLTVLARELDSAKQYYRMLEGQGAPRSQALQGAEHRLPAGDRNALVSETQAGGGSALHRWIRAQVADPHADGASADSTFAASTPGIGRGTESFVKLADIPHEFLCPITQDVMRDAVSTCDGHTYERRNIDAWLSENSTSPITGLPLANKTLIPNHNLRKLILDSGVLSRLEPDAKPDTEAPKFRSDVCCEIVVPRDAPTLDQAFLLGADRAAALAVGADTSLPRGRSRGHSIGSGDGTRTGPGPVARPPAFAVRLLAGEHILQKSMQIEQEVEIVGSGASVTMLKLAAEATIDLRGSARIANVAICRESSGNPGSSNSTVNAMQSGQPRLGGRSAALLEISQGNCRIEHCDLSNAVGTAIRVSGAHTSPVISRNTIHGCLDTGVVFQHGADGTLASNRLFGNCSVAIEVHTRADPLIEDNDIFDGRQGGVFVYSRGKGHLRRNKIFRNALEGVEIKHEGRPLVEDNDIYDNLECGIFIHEGGEGRVIQNRIHSNSYAGIEIKDASCPEVRGNDVYSGRTSGMYVHSGGHGVIEGNHIHQNWLHGIYVRNKGCPHMLKNNICRNDECGVFVTESSHPCIEHNEVHSNGLAGIEVKEESNPTIKINRIYDGNTGGIFVLSRGRGRIFENKLYKNKLEGIEIKDGGDPQVIDNEIYENLECGVFAHDGALGRIEENRIFGNAYAGVEIKDLSSPVVKSNKIYRGHTSGVYVHSGGRGKVLENEVFENGLHGIMILSGGNPWLSGNKVHDNVECGVVSHAGYTLDTSGNQIFANRIKNVQVVKS